VLLADQDRGRWDHLLVRRGLAGLARAEALVPAGRRRDPYTLQAGIAACHARAGSVADTDWAAMAALYAELAVVAPSPVVELNRAVVVGRAEGPAAGLALVDALRDEPALARYHLLPAVRADLLVQLGRREEAAAELERAAALASNEAERALLHRRLEDLREGALGRG
jgi:predicted RNA polymerase sigma factor